MVLTDYMLAANLVPCMHWDAHAGRWRALHRTGSRKEYWKRSLSRSLLRSTAVASTGSVTTTAWQANNYRLAERVCWASHLQMPLRMSRRASTTEYML